MSIFFRTREHIAVVLWPKSFFVVVVSFGGSACGACQRDLLPVSSDCFDHFVPSWRMGTSEKTKRDNSHLNEEEREETGSCEQETG